MTSTADTSDISDPLEILTERGYFVVGQFGTRGADVAIPVVAAVATEVYPC